jgi:hypothetical protein
MERVVHLQDQKALAETVEKAKDPNFDPFKDYREEKGGWTRYISSKMGTWSKFQKAMAGMIEKAKSALSES